MESWTSSTGEAGQVDRPWLVAALLDHGSIHIFCCIFHHFSLLLFFCCLRPKCFLRRFDLVRWRFGLRPATRPATRQTRVVPCRCRWLQARSSSQSQCLDANCELEDVYFSPKGGMIPVRQSHVHHVGRCWKMNHKLQIFVKPQMEL